MPPVTYLSAPHIPTVNLLDVIEASTSSQKEPSLDLQWEPFQTHVEAFLRAIDKYAQDARIEIAGRTQEHIEEVRELKAGKAEMERRIGVEREKEAHMLANLESERHAQTDLSSTVNHLETTLQKIRDQSTSLESELNALKRDVKAERTDKERQQALLEDQRGLDAAELDALEECLGMSIDGIGGDSVLVRFRLVDPSDAGREFALVLDVSKNEYEVTRCDPPIPNLGELVSRLTDDRDLMGFLKRVRKAFRATVPEPAKPVSRFDDLPGPGVRTPGGLKRPLEDATEDRS